MENSILFYGAEVFDSDRLSFVRADVLVKDGKIVSIGENIESGGCENVTKIDVSGKLLAPGLVDVHTHGRSGKDFTSADKEGMYLLARSYLLSGVTSLMPTLASAEFDSLLNSCSLIKEISCEKNNQSGARFIGTHLEGRYLNPNKRGAHAPEMLKKPDAEEIKLLLEKMTEVKHISAAFELDEDGSFAKAALDFGATLGLAHTCATYDQSVKAVERGVTSFTHLYNCMPQLHHRDGGAVCKALTDKNVYAEIIVDGIHINPEMVRLAYMMKGSEKLVLITDSMEATGCPDGEYFIAGEPVTVKDGKALTHEGALAGSTLSLIDGVRNLAKFCGISFGEALVCATRNPAKMVKAELVGELKPGYFADMLILDKSFALDGVVLGGEICK